MAKTNFKDVDEYIATFPADVQVVLRAVRKAIREGAPDAEEVISYQMPAYRSHGLLIYFGGFKQHYSLFCPDAGASLAAFSEDLAPYRVAKSTIHFPLDGPVPADLIRRIAAHQAAHNAAKSASKRKRP